MVISLEFEGSALVDHHCHGVYDHDVSRAEFEASLNEGPGSSVLGTSVFDSMLGLALRRWCAPILNLEPFCSPDDYLLRRTELGFAEVNRRFLSLCGISDFIVDTGFAPNQITSPAATAAYAGQAAAHEIIRLESTAADLIDGGTTTADFDDALRERLSGSGAVGAKSIAAYRAGLKISAQKPDPATVREALAACVADGKPARINDRVLHSYLAWTAIELQLPLQFHVGYGDNDVNLLDCDPLLLTPFLRATHSNVVPILLLHNYPFHRNAGYLAQVFGHVFVDLGLSTHNTGAFSRWLLPELLELAPFGKVLFSSDAFGLSELYYLGAILFRRALSNVTDRLIGSGDMQAADADRLVALISRHNAARVYGLATG
ncbi:MAG: amidohydrolase family protein [Antricoccus sp.]